MQKIIALSIVVLALTGCVRKISIEQGNVMTPEMSNQLHIGMNEEEVKNVMGSPMLLNTFNDNRIDYVYTFKPGNGTMTEKKMILSFKNGVLTNISGNMPAPNNK